MRRRAAFVLGAALIAVCFADGSSADAKGVCLERALQQGYATRNEYGAIVYAPHQPTADDFAACGMPVPAGIVLASPNFAG